ncbi:hypothetical protein JI743_08245 [Sphingopyxis sp. DHUNG17]|uniref:hypothetical protein n=1 Tax=Sphingopyxis TaxID=165697 RepID=UPI00191EA87B|nr:MULTISPECIES: hypothetical protein [Sphingopyxis]MBL0768792.1 hypothetical protein [Sphingopyxis lutea]
MINLRAPSRQSRFTLLCVSTFIAAVGSIPAAANAQENCPGASAPNGKVFGKRFGKLMGAAGVAAITGRKAAARAAADAAARDTADSARENAVAAAAASGCRDDETPPPVDSDASTPAQNNARARKSASAASYSRPSEMPISAEIKAQKSAFVEFSKVRCSDCEGGHDYEAWASRYFYSELLGDAKAWTAKLAKMEPGEKLNWQGTENYGTITMREQAKVGGFDCKIYDWLLEKGKASARREGLICWGKASSFSASDSWVEVY